MKEIHVDVQDTQPAEFEQTKQDLQAPGKYLQSWRLTAMVAGTAFAVFAVAIDTSMITTTGPIITSELKSLDSLAWISSAYTLALTVCQPILGTIYTIFDTRTVYISSMGIFEIGSLLCAFAPNGSAFIIGRAIQGTGAAGLLQGSVTLISLAVEPKRRPLFLSITPSLYGIAMAFGPVLGGVFAGRLTWRWCYWINLPIGAICCTLLLGLMRFQFRRSKQVDLTLFAKLRRLDVLGAIILTAGCVCLLLALQYGGQEYPFSSPMIIGLFVGGGSLILLFLAVQYYKQDNALLPLKILRQRSIATGFIVVWLMGAANTVICFYMPFYFQTVLGTDAIGSALRFMAYFLPLMVAVGLAGAIVSKLGYYVPYMLCGGILAVISCAFLISITESTPTYRWCIPLVFTAIGVGSVQQLPFTAVNVVLDDEHLAMGNAVITFGWMLGGAMSVAIGQNIALGAIRALLPIYTTEMTPSQAIATGGYDLAALPLSTSALQALRTVWSIAIDRTMIEALVALCLAVPAIAAMEWKNSRRAVEQKEKQTNQLHSANDSRC